MYEDQDYLTILERELNRTPDDLDKAEGSLLWEAIGPGAAEFELVYMALDKLIKNAYPITADREYLIRYAETYNIAPLPATKAVLEAEFILQDGRTIDNGSRFEIDGLFYTVIEKLDETKYKIECETAGTIGNKYYGQLLPAVFVQGFTSAKITQLLIPGEDEEETEEFRARFIRSFNSKAYGWNEAEYIEEVCKLPGVGDCKILRCPRGEGTVDVIIIDSLFKKPTDETVESVQTALRPLNVTGPPEIDNCGTGMVAIGHNTIVYGVREREIEIGLKLFFEEGYSWENAKSGIEEALKEYFTELAKTWGDRNYYTKTGHAEPQERHIEIQLSDIEHCIYDLPSVKDYDRFSSTINGKTENAALEWDEIPVLKAVVESTGGTGPRPGECNCPDCPHNYQCQSCERMTG